MLNIKLLLHITLSFFFYTNNILATRMFEEKELFKNQNILVALP